jgi:hypothetical protein
MRSSYLLRIGGNLRNLREPFLFFPLMTLIIADHIR